MNLLWTERDLDIIETLTRRLRLLAIEQIARIWWPRAGSRRVIRRRLRVLADANLIHRTIANVHPLLDVSRPLAQWSPGDDEPDFWKVSQDAKNRWQSASRPHEVFFATKLACCL